MKGPENTAYQNGISTNLCFIIIMCTSTGAFVLSLEFPDKYPSVPPQVRFLTPVRDLNECKL